jgi:hypothetical protein
MPNVTVGCLTRVIHYQEASSLNLGPRITYADDRFLLCPQNLLGQ